MQRQRHAPPERLPDHGRWRRKALFAVLCALLLPFVVAAALRAARDGDSAAPAGSSRPGSLWNQARGGGRLPTLAPVPTLPPLGAPRPIPPAQIQTLEPVRPTELAELPPEIADDVGDEGGEAPALFLARAPGAREDEAPDAYARLAAKIVGNTTVDRLPRTKKLEAAHLFMKAGQFVKAWGLFSTEQASGLGAEGRIKAMMAAISSGRAEDCLAWLGDAPPDPGERAEYWWANLLQRAGKPERARPVFRRIAERSPRYYYGIWAAARLEQPGSIRTPILLDGRITRTTSDLPPRSVALVELSGLVRRHGAAMSQLGRAFELASAGSDVAAAEELRLAYRYRAAAFDGADAAALARIARTLGDEELALRIDPPDSLRAYHRHAWRALVFAAGERHGIDPDLVWAVMLRESYFHTNASSPAGATGLMQMMPETGRSIARELGVRSFQPQMLLMPDTAIDFGAFLLAALLRRYDGMVPVAIAAYNAGIEPVDAWVAAQRGSEPDVFGELIPYPETHRYVRRVLSSLAIYQAEPDERASVIPSGTEEDTE